jgi:predicted O-methyltransferase YrrM
MSLYFPPSLQRYDPIRMVFSTWVDHMPFGYDIVEAIRPSLVVELGTYNGLSFFTFCQSMKENNIDGLCYAVDTWEGDEHTGGYDNSIMEDVRSHAREHYRGTTYLLQMYFNEALPQFEDNSIELLHIDGLHTYEAVKEDFENWYPKVAPGGIVLFHDVQAKLKEYGAWKFWEELTQEHDSFTFNHGFGLGVLRKPNGEEPQQPLLKLLFRSDATEQQSLRQLYVHASAFMDARRKSRRFDSMNPKPNKEKKGGQGKADN